MSVRLKLVVIVLFVALVPISVSAWVSLRIHQEAFERNLAHLHEIAASQEAQRVGVHLKKLHDTLQRLATSSLPWNELTADERQAALWLLYRADEDIVAVMLMDAEHRLVTRPAYLTEATAADEPRHLPQPDTIVAEVQRHLPHEYVDAVGGGYGQPFVISTTRAPVLALGIPLASPQPGQSGGIVGVGVSLRAVCKSGPKPEGIELLVVDSARRSVCAAGQFGPLTAMGTDRGRRSDSVPAVRTYRARNGQQVLSAEVALPYGWHVVAEQPIQTAFAASRRMRLQAVLWIIISVAIALASGLILVRGISEPVRRLLGGVAELARGNLEHRFESLDKDEFGRLGLAFDHMANEISARDAEIRAWNSELQQKVQERTLAIEQYHDHLLHAEKSAAMARLTAGVAAEVNDPLTGILGALQFLALRARTDPGRAEEARLCANAEAGAQRIRKLIKRVQALGQRQPRSQLRPVAVHDLVASAVTLLKQSPSEADVDVVRFNYGGVPPVLGNFTQLEQALFQLLTNAVAACSTELQSKAIGALSADDSPPVRHGRKHRILIEARIADGSKVRISVSDDGVGIPTQDLERIFEPFVVLRAQTGPGLGLTIARRIVEEHGGKLWAESNSAAGATLFMQLPAAESLVP